MNDQPGHGGNGAWHRKGLSVQAALASAFDAHAGNLYRYALMILADHSAAEDVVQQIFVKLAGMDDKLGQIESFNGYLRTAVRRECYNAISRRQRDRENRARPLLEPASNAAVDEDERLSLETALRALPPDQREIIHLKLYEAMTFRKIAEVLGISPNTAASRYRYAIERLRKRLDPRSSANGDYNE